MYHHRERNERNNSLMSTSRRTRQEVIEEFTRALPLRKIDMDAIPSMPSGKFIVYRKNAIVHGDSDDDDDSDDESGQLEEEESNTPGEDEPRD